MLAFITGLAGPVLTDAERRFLQEADPWGLILFKRNVSAPDDVRRLVGEFRSAVGREAPVLIDQEGGRVQRLGPPYWPAYPPGAAYGALYDRDRSAGLTAAKLGGRLIAEDLRQLGIDVDCAPVADVPIAAADPIIGDRAYGANPAKVATLAGAARPKAHPRPRPSDRRQPPDAACGHRRPGHARCHRFCRISSAARTADGHDRTCCVYSDRSGRAGHDFGHYSAERDSRFDWLCGSPYER
jgi:hypothetical protein